MSTRQLPVTIAVQRADGRTEHVRVGTATPDGDGFRLRLDDLRIGGAPAADVAPSVFKPPAYRPSPGSAPTMLPNYGRSKGEPISTATIDDLEYYANGARRTLNDPSKERFHHKERALLAALEAEIKSRDQQTSDRPRGPAEQAYDDIPRPSGPSYPPGPLEGFEPPPHTDDDFGPPPDDDIPF